MIRPAVASDLPLLGPIESAGDAMFAQAGHPEFVGQPPLPIESLTAAMEQGWLLVGELNERPVGFLCFDRYGDELAIHQISVDPAVGRQGIGTQLMKHGLAKAHEQAEATLVLDTQADVPWNQPWYERFGFVVIVPSQWTPAMKALAAEQTSAGLDWTTRVHMRLTL